MLPRIRTIELNWLNTNKICHHSLLRQIKDTLGWQDRILRPRLSFVLDPPGYDLYHAIWVEKEVHEFLYEGGVNPFRNRRGPVPGGVGIVIDVCCREIQ
ncbi:hypothetical protein FHL15_006735 [Xylaria flabelliformis]|uniref:Uncharacterized protein n=1 Tax=Xylaria flabelliformis TaxID=2512241 RepID=A0A553HWL3_9PEZI|nr:hypothetical protein FHL15_006735 [Xylaria flabelliformis]